MPIKNVFKIVSPRRNGRLFRAPITALQIMGAAGLYSVSAGLWATDILACRFSVLCSLFLSFPSLNRFPKPPCTQIIFFLHATRGVASLITAARNCTDARVFPMHSTIYLSRVSFFAISEFSDCTTWCQGYHLVE